MIVVVVEVASAVEIRLLEIVAVLLPSSATVLFNNDDGLENPDTDVDDSIIVVLEDVSVI